MLATATATELAHYAARYDAAHAALPLAPASAAPDVQARARQAYGPAAGWHASPHYNARPHGLASVTAVVLHSDAESSAQHTIDYMAQPRPADGRRVSYHALVGRNGVVTGLVLPEYRAWHAGVSEFAGVPDCNDYALGFAFANRNDGVERYPEAQLAAMAALCVRALRACPALTLDRITTHRAVALPLGRKTDPAPAAFALAPFLARVRALLPGAGLTATGTSAL